MNTKDFELDIRYGGTLMDEAAMMMEDIARGITGAWIHEWRGPGPPGRGLRLGA